MRIYPKIVQWAKIAGGALAAATLLAGCPHYKVYSYKYHGMAELERAEQNRQILVKQAAAERDAAVQRAEAIRIVGEAAQKYPEYRQQEFIGAFAEAVKDGKINQIIYVPTEANIPLTEAGKR